MNKRITALFAAACLAASFTPAFAADTVDAVVSADKTTVAQNETFTVTVTFDGAENVNGAGYRLYYDPAVLEVVSTEKGDLLNFEYSQMPQLTDKVVDVDENTQRGQVTAAVGFDDNYNITDTEFFSVEFRVKADAEPGEYTDLLGYDAGSSYVADGIEYTDVVSAFPEKITITEAPAVVHELKTAVDNATPAVGDTVTYTISTDETIPFIGMQFDLDFDPSVLEFTGGEFAADGMGAVAVNGQDNTKVNYVWVSSDAKPVDISGTVATASFKVLSVGDAAVTASNFVSSPDSMVFTMPQVNIAGTGVLSFECDNDQLTAGDVMHVSVKAGSMQAQQGIQFDVRYDNSMLRYAADSIKINEVVNTDGITSTARLMEDGNIRFVLVCTDKTKTLSGDTELFSFDLKPAENAEGTAQLSFDGIAAMPLMSSMSKDVTVYGSAVSAAVENTEALINAIPEEITNENYNDALTAYNAAKTAYDALSDNEKALVNNYEKLQAAAAAFGNVDAVMEAIEALAPSAENYVESKAAAEAARAMYESLTDAAKANVGNYDKLTAAETTIAALTKQVDDAAAAVNAVVTATADNYADAKAAAAAYTALTESQKSVMVLNEGVDAAAFLESFNALAAQIDSVEASISAIGAVTADNAAEKKELINAARTAYDALNEAMRADVENYDTLLMAEALYIQYAGLEITVTKADDSYTVDINDLRGSAAPQTVIIVTYKDGIPVSVNIEASNAEEPVSVSADTASEECRVFVWNSLESMIPFTGAHIEYAY